MLLNIFNGIVIGLFLKLISIGLVKGIDFVDWTDPLNGIVLTNNGVLTVIGKYLGIIIMLTSLSIAIGYHFFSKRELLKSRERRFSSRIVLMILTASLFDIWSHGLHNTPGLSFLWASSLLAPDTIGKLGGYPVNLLAILTVSAYTFYAVTFGMKRRSLSWSLHLSVLLGFILLSYNMASGFFLFWLIQSISLAYLAMKIPIILEPKK